MVFRPDDIAQKEFLPSFRGYSRREVREYLTALAAQMRAQESGTVVDQLGDDQDDQLLAVHGTVDTATTEGSGSVVTALHGEGPAPLRAAHIDVTDSGLAALSDAHELGASSPTPGVSERT